jgi:hypothetical protein
MLALYDVGPWNAWRRHGSYNFVDKSARWIWSHEDGATYDGWNDAPYIGDVFTFSTSVRVSKPTEAIMHIISDNIAVVYLNDKKVETVKGGWKSGMKYPKVRLSLRSGLNIITIKAKNTGGPGGFIASILASGNVLRRTNVREWNFGEYDEDYGTEGASAIFAASPSRQWNETASVPLPMAVEESSSIFGMSSKTMIIVAIVLVMLLSLSSGMAMMMMR